MILFDLETTKIPDTGINDIETIHCVAWCDSESDEIHSTHTKKGLRKFVEFVADKDICAHNLIGFDLPVLKNFYPDIKFTGEVYDTLVMARALWHDVIVKDFGRAKAGRLPPRLKGSHSLEAYGYRLRINKGEYGKVTENAWDHWSQDMEDYCVQDVAVLKALYLKQLNAKPSDVMIELENKFAVICQRQMAKGVAFDEVAAIKLMIKLRSEKDKIYGELKQAFPMHVVPKDMGKVHTSKVNNRARSISKGAQFSKISYREFNPNSRQQIAERLIKKYGWNPTEVTDKGTIQVNEIILKGLDYPEAKLLERGMMISKRLGQLADGNQALLKHIKKGRIHGYINTGGTISGRCSHSRPNLAQTPSINSPFGGDFRSLFTVLPGYVMVGCDACGLELRCLGHYLARFDGGKYANIILNGDIHTANQKAAELPTRNMAKTFIYGWLYGAGAAKLGSIIGGGAKEGAILQNRFMKKFPAIKKLKEAVVEAVETRGYIKGLDGRRLRTRSPHAALNLLLQSAGALLMKRALIECDRLAKEAKLDYEFVLNIHDEWQAEVNEKDAEKFAEVSERAIELAGEYFKFRMITNGEAKIGKNWKETH